MAHHTTLLRLLGIFLLFFSIFPLLFTQQLDGEKSAVGASDKSEGRSSPAAGESPVIPGATSEFADTDSLPLPLLHPTYRNEKIKEDGCALTVLLVTPSVKSLEFKALESVARNVYPATRTCVTIQTSTCGYFADKKKGPRDVEEESAAYAKTVGEIQQSALAVSSDGKTKFPVFAAMIRAGLVRVAVLDHKKYKLSGCDDYRNLPAWMNYHYWEDEFTKEDSDSVLTLQGDARLCHTFNAELWGDIAYAGAPWHPMLSFDPPALFPRRWHEWHSHLKETIPYPTNDTISRDVMYGAFGNGGLSLRKRSWLQKAVRYCPHRNYSGLRRRDFVASKCRVGAYVQEDVYYSIVLKGMGAPLPSVFEASLFSTETIMPKEIVDWYKLNETYVLEAMGRRLWGRGSDEGLGGLTLADRDARRAEFGPWSPIRTPMESNATTGATNTQIGITSLGYHHRTPDANEFLRANCASYQSTGNGLAEKKVDLFEMSSKKKK